MTRLAAALVASTLLVACGAEAGPPGSVAVEVLAPQPVGPVLLVPVHRARVVAEDGVVAEWQLATDRPVEVTVPAGRHVLEAWTVFLSDVVVCEPDPAVPEGQTCVQPTTGPGMVCRLDIDVRSEAVTRASYVVLGDGRCRLDPAG